MQPAMSMKSVQFRKGARHLARARGDDQVRRRQGPARPGADACAVAAPVSRDAVVAVGRAVDLADRALVEHWSRSSGARTSSSGTRQRKSVADFFLWKLPSTIRAAKWHILVSLIITVAGALAAYSLTMRDADYYYSFVGDMAQGRTPASSTNELREGLYHSEGMSSMLKHGCPGAPGLRKRLVRHVARAGPVAGCHLPLCSTTGSCSARSLRCFTRAGSASICGHGCCPTASPS
jgi:hypothetical protein